MIKLYEWVLSLQKVIDEMPGHKRLNVQLYNFHFSELVSQFLFKAWIQQLSLENPDVFIKGLYGVAHPNIQDFKMIGLLDLIKPVTEITIKPERNIRSYNFTASLAHRHSQPESRASFNIAGLFSKCCAGDVEKVNTIMVALNEAFMNVREWAYEYTNLPPEKQSWWISGIVDDVKKELSIMMYDCGYSLPRHFRKNILEDRKSFREKLNISHDARDCDLIDAAFKIGQPEVRDDLQRGRTYGLEQMRDMPKSFQTGKFIVRSGHGGYRMSCKDGKELSGIGIQEAKFKIPGSLFCWVIQE